MIVVVSCHPTPDDERIYHRQIKTLLSNGYSITYFSRSKSDLDLSEAGLKHINLSINLSIRSYSKQVLQQLQEPEAPLFFHIHVSKTIYNIFHNNRLYQRKHRILYLKKT